MKRDQVDEVVRCVAEEHLAPMAPGSELEPRKSVDRHGIGLDAGHVTQGDVGAALAQQRDTPGRRGRAGRRARSGR